MTTKLTKEANYVRLAVQVQLGTAIGQDHGHEEVIAEDLVKALDNTCALANRCLQIIMSRSNVPESLPFRAAAVRALFNLRGKELDNPVTSWEPYRPRRKKTAVKTSRRRRESSSLFCEGTSEYGNTGVSPSVHDRCSQGERTDISVDLPTYDRCLELKATDMSMVFISNDECPKDRNPSNDELLRSDAVRPLRTAAIRALYKIRGPDLDTPVASCEQPRRRRRYKQAVKTD
ncbi:hypothetical protein KIN20_026183 [Parelaphostrongylus tenuis]|uniref:Uncharacterized protein n=1 Tax=Parelaphostrongylus tenuis TaxID=148309 RepID=A0AAD5QXW0_PARTN|nr:hypothetical protein KIN20_026183 [Parelaphostrongylus tenuis]